VKVNNAKPFVVVTPAQDISRRLRAGDNRLSIMWQSSKDPDNDEDLALEEHTPTGANNYIMGVHVGTGIWGSSPRYGEKNLTIYAR